MPSSTSRVLFAGAAFSTTGWPSSRMIIFHVLENLSCNFRRVWYGIRLIKYAKKIVQQEPLQGGQENAKARQEE